MGQDIVKPPPDPMVAFERKYALDSLPAFLRISSTYVHQTKDKSIINEQWLTALTAILTVLHEQSQSTFDEQARMRDSAYSFQRPSGLSIHSVYNGLDQPANAGTGNPVKSGTGLIKSAFRASDDATIFPFHIPSNAFMAVELSPTAEIIQSIYPDLASECTQLGHGIREGIYTYGVADHPVFGKVFADEVDGYGSRLLMDDASPPSLLSLPYLGFMDASDELYRATRRMVLSKEGNPYYVVGSEMEGQGSAHINVKTMWPVGTIIRILTSDDDEEIRRCLQILKKSSPGLGLVHEGMDVNDWTKILRTWYAWGNSAFAEMILDLAKRKPEIVFGSESGSVPAVLDKDETKLKL